MQVNNCAHINSSVYGMVIVVTGCTVRIICLQMLHNNVYLKINVEKQCAFPPPHIHARVHTHQFMLEEHCSMGGFI